jgi:hypothetical protein
MSISKSSYTAVEMSDRDQIVRELALLSDAGKDGVTMFETYAAHVADADEEVRGLAVLGFGHVARLHRTLPVGRVVPLIEAARRDPSDTVKNAAEVAFGDIEYYVLDPPRPADDGAWVEDETIDIPSMNVSAAIRRNLRRTPHFIPSRGPFRRDEWRVGWYFNPEPKPRLLFTTIGMHVIGADDSWFVDWSGISAPREENDGVHIQTPAGERFVPVAGRHGTGESSADAFLFFFFFFFFFLR